MDQGQEKRRTLFISFSGIDGAGKSTQIAALCGYCEWIGLRVRLIAFWNDVARLTRVREGTGHRVFKGDKGVGTPTAPINRRDKNVTSWPMTAVRLLLYFIDAVWLRFKGANAFGSDADVVVFDRYIYDELANLPLRSGFMRAYARLILSFVPRPDIGFLLDADPIAARARKPEYPLEFLYANRESYLGLSRLAGMRVIAPMPAREVEQEILRHIRTNLQLEAARNASDGSKEFTENETVSKKLDRQHTHPAAL